MNVTVVGPGAMGCLFAVRLARAGVDTVLVDYREDRAARLRESGIAVEDGEGAEASFVPVATTTTKGSDLIIVCVKSYDTQRLALPCDAPVLTLQNGLGNVEAICSQVGNSQVLAGVTSEACILLAEGRVKHTAHGTTTIGSWTTCPVEAAGEVLRKSGFQIELTDAPGQAIWQKAALSAGINPLTAILNVPNGRLLEITETRQLMRDLVVEAVKVAAVEGYRFPTSVVESAEQLCGATRDNISSMLQDVRAGRRTEIDAISGKILQRAQEAGLPTPRTRVIWQLVKGLEQR